MGLIEHLESRLGRIEGGSRNGPGDEALPFTVVRCSGGVLPGVTTFSTVGLSNHPLPSRVSDKHLHQELLICVPSDQAEGPIGSILQQVAHWVLKADSAVLRGEVIGPYGPLLDGSAMEAFYAAIPVLFDDDFAVVPASDDGRRFDIVLTWLIPLGRTEAAFVDRHGWKAFESELIRHQPDLTDPRRPEMPLRTAIA